MIETNKITKGTIRSKVYVQNFFVGRANFFNPEIKYTLQKSPPNSFHFKSQNPKKNSFKQENTSIFAKNS